MGTVYMIQCENGQVFHVAADDAAQAWEIVQGTARHTEPVAVNGSYEKTGNALTDNVNRCIAQGAPIITEKRDEHNADHPWYTGHVVDLD